MTTATTKRSRKSAKPRSTNPKVEIKQSHIHGLGLFAARRIRKGEVIGLYEGREVTDEEDNGDHVLWIYDEDTGKEYGIDGRTETRYVNHSQKPNADFNGEILEALKQIRSGDEITFNYGEAWSEDE
jgi:uncharacterized protein